MVHAKRCKEALGNRRVVRLTSQDLDDPPQHRKTDIAVRHHRTRLKELGQHRTHIDKSFDAAVAAIAPVRDLEDALYRVESGAA